MLLFPLRGHPAGGSLATIFSKGLVFRHFTRLIGPKECSDCLALAVAVQMVYAKPGGCHEEGGSHEVNRDMSECFFHL